MTESARRARTGRHVVITAGPTREHVDPVRFLSNESSGRMGFAIARAAAARGDLVTLIAGPVHLETPPGVERVDVVSARDMLAAVKTAFEGADVLIMSAAVGDWRPARKLAGKWRKKDDGSDSASLELVKNPDILATVARDKGDRLVIGFALETGDGLRRARAKMKRKGADYVVLNDASALNSDSASVTVLGCDGSERRITARSKDEIAAALVELDRPAPAQ
jgi:phosphopantothenoylcysteine decarboxylase / phosphopantothenate---cysteine ligase